MGSSRTGRQVQGFTSPADAESLCSCQRRRLEHPEGFQHRINECRKYVLLLREGDMTMKSNRLVSCVVRRCCLAGFALCSGLAMAQARQQFLVAPQYATGRSSYVAAVGDFNKDGKLDLVWVSSVG